VCATLVPHQPAPGEAAGRRLLGRVRLLAIALVMVLTGCATPAGVTPDPQLLAFLQDGATPRSEALLRLGEPSGFFEGERIVTWRIAGDAKRGRWVQSRAATLGGPATLVAKESLVLVFDEHGMLERHALVPIEQ
jgi:hypothetical protein